jgi:hypothetical protein
MSYEFVRRHGQGSQLLQGTVDDYAAFKLRIEITIHSARQENHRPLARIIVINLENQATIVEVGAARSFVAGQLANSCV